MMTIPPLVNIKHPDQFIEQCIGMNIFLKYQHLLTGEDRINTLKCLEELSYHYAESSSGR